MLGERWNGKRTERKEGKFDGLAAFHVVYVSLGKTRWQPVGGILHFLPIKKFYLNFKI